MPIHYSHYIYTERVPPFPEFSQRRPSGNNALAMRVHGIGSKLCPEGDGVYVEAGANDGISWSNTLMLEDLGWSGLLIEPSTTAYAKLIENRPGNYIENVALVDYTSPSQIRGTFATGSLMGTAHADLKNRDIGPFTSRGITRLFKRTLGLKSPTKQITVPATTLDSLLHRHRIRKVDLLILDVEGSELQALNGLCEVRPRVMVVETRRIDAFNINDLLLNRGYILCANLSGFTESLNPQWTRDHQDYCWCLAGDVDAIRAVLNLGPKAL